MYYIVFSNEELRNKKQFIHMALYGINKIKEAKTHFDYQVNQKHNNHFDRACLCKSRKIGYIGGDDKDIAEWYRQS